VRTEGGNAAATLAVVRKNHYLQEMNARFYSAPDSAAGIREERQRERRQKGEFREMQKEREKGEEKAKEERRLRRDEQRERMGKGRGEGEKGETRKKQGHSVCFNLTI